MTAEAAGDPQPLTQLPDLRHAMHGLPDGPAPDFCYLDPSEFGKDRPDPSLNGASEAFWPRGPGCFRARPHQAVALYDSEMIDAVGIAHRSLEGHQLGKAFAEWRSHPG